MFQKICIIGVGLIGGSIAAAVKQRGLARQVVAYSPFDGEEAFRLGLIDSLAADAVTSVTNADLLVVATPPASVAIIIEQVLASLPLNALVTDVSSVKAPVMARVKQVMGERYSQFVSSHPIAGAESSGPSAARADLFESAQVIINPNNPNNDKRVEAFWRALGAQVRTMDVAQHDAVYAAVSHLPHAVAFALCLALSRQSNASALGAYGAGGLRDTSRVGASSAALWANILLDNDAALLPLMQDQAQAFQEIAQAIQDKDKSRLRAMLEQASAWRRSV